MILSIKLKVLNVIHIQDKYLFVVHDNKFISKLKFRKRITILNFFNICAERGNRLFSSNCDNRSILYHNDGE